MRKQQQQQQEPGELLVPPSVVSLRPSFTNDTNLFVRCTPTTLTRLHIDEREQFAILKLSFIFSNKNETVVVYASYNGGTLSEGEEADRIELPVQFAHDTINSNNNQGENKEFLLHASVIPTIPVATQLLVEPNTPDDWYALNAHADWLEDGGWLQQVSVVYCDQVLSLQLSPSSSPNTTATVKIVASNFQPTWPDDPPCARLTNDTQLVVMAPEKTNDQSTINERPITKLTLVPTNWDLSKTFQILLSLLSHKGAVPIDSTKTAAVHPKTHSALVGGVGGGVCLLQVGHSDKDTAGGRTVVRLVACDAVDCDGIAVHPLVRLRLRAHLYDQGSVQRLEPYQVCDAQNCLGDSSVRLQTVQVLRTKQPRWYCPDVLQAEYPLEADNLPVDSPFENPNDPYCVGDFVCLSKGTTTARRLYQVVVDEPFTSCCAAIIPANKLETALDAELVAPFSEALPIEARDSNDSTYLWPVLPDRTCFSPSILEMVRKVAVVPACVLYGDRGSGKTHIALIAASLAHAQHRSKVIYLDCKKLRDSGTVRMQNILDELTKSFRQAMSGGSCSILLDDLDAIVSTVDQTSTDNDSLQQQQVDPVEISQSLLVSDVLRSAFRTIRNTNVAVRVIVTCGNPDALPASLWSDGGFGHTFAIPTPSAADRHELLQSMLKHVGLSPHCGNSLSKSFSDIVSKTRGFRPRDLEQLSLRLKQTICSGNVRESDILREVECFVPLSRLGVRVEETKVAVEWTEIGGLFRAKHVLETTIIRPSLYRRIYDQARVRLPRGVLLFGYPGTGKSLCVPALAKKSGFPLITCRGPEILDKYIGASEAKVRQLFSRAAAAAPSILFFDELDSLAPSRGSDQTGVTDRVVNQLLTFLDGVEVSSQQGPVYVIAATSRPDRVDAALLRPGRLEKHIFFGFAEGDAESQDLVRTVASGFRLSSCAADSIASGRLFRTIKEDDAICWPLSGADLKAVFTAAQLDAAHDALDKGRTDEPVSISLDHLVGALRCCRPSLSRSDLDQFTSIYAPFLSERKPESSHGSANSAPLKTALK